MKEKNYSKTELSEIASDILELLRPKHLRIFEIKQILNLAIKKTDCIVFQEKTK